MIQLAACSSSKERTHVDLAMSIDEYYDTVNSKISYTMVEFTTPWCHHCKKLKPNFLKLSKMYENDTTVPPVKFLEVNCEVFGTTICRDMPGFPMIYLIQPRVKPLILPKSETSVPFWRKLWTKIRNRIEDPMWQLDKDRIINYNGKREAIPMKKFIESVRAKDALVERVNNVLNDKFECSQDDEPCQLGKRYVLENLDKLSPKQLGQERLKLESIIKNAGEKEDDAIKVAIELIKFKLQILNHFDKSNEEQINVYDEL